MTKNLIHPDGMIPYPLQGINARLSAGSYNTVCPTGNELILRQQIFPVKLPHMTCQGLFSSKEIFTIYNIRRVFDIIRKNSLISNKF